MPRLSTQVGVAPSRPRRDLEQSVLEGDHGMEDPRLGQGEPDTLSVHDRRREETCCSQSTWLGWHACHEIVPVLSLETFCFVLDAWHFGYQPRYSRIDLKKAKAAIGSGPGTGWLMEDGKGEYSLSQSTGSSYNIIAKKPDLRLRVHFS